MDKCKYCRKRIVWAKQMVWNDFDRRWELKAGAKANPIEEEPHAQGNIVLHGTRQFYRMATEAEIRESATYGKNLYRSHFAQAECAAKAREDAKDYGRMMSKRKKTRTINEATWGARP